MYKQFLEQVKNIESHTIFAIPNLLTPPPTVRKNGNNLKKIKTETFYNLKKNDIYTKYLNIKYTISKK